MSVRLSLFGNRINLPYEEALQGRADALHEDGDFP